MSPRTLPPRRKALVAAGGAVLLAAIGFGLAAARPSTASDKPASAAPPAIPVTVAVVQPREVTPYDEFSGRLEAVDRVEVRPRVAGAIQSVHFTEGALVHAGEPLLTIDPAPYAAEVDRAQAQLAAAQAKLENATTEQARSQRLWEDHAIAQRELDQRVNARRTAQADVRAAEAALRLAKLNLGYTEVRAPVGGRVGKLEVTAGNLVAAGPTAPVLTTIVSVSPIYASFDADEGVVERALREVPAAAGRPSLGRIPVEIATGDDATLRGRLQLIDNHVNPSSGTVRVRAVFDNREGRLMPGQFVRVRLGHAKPEKAMLVSESAIGTDQDKRYVLVVGEGNKVAYRPVALGPTVDGLRVVSDGLNPGERIVVNGLQRVRPGAVVQPMDAGATKTASR
jgi:multidrug efflux system membrane fusion protein